jgi:hypothetical protein
MNQTLGAVEAVGTKLAVKCGEEGPQPNRRNPVRKIFPELLTTGKPLPRRQVESFPALDIQETLP